MSLTHCVADALSRRSPSPQGSNAGAGLRDVTNSSSGTPKPSQTRAMLAAFAGSVQSSSTTSRSPRRLATRPSTLERKRASVARLLALRLLNRQVAAIALESAIYATGNAHCFRALVMAICHAVQRLSSLLCQIAVRFCRAET